MDGFQWNLATTFNDETAPFTIYHLPFGIFLVKSPRPSGTLRGQA